MKGKQRQSCPQGSCRNPAQRQYNRELVERARARYYCSTTKMFKRHIPGEKSIVCFDENAPYKVDPPAKKMTKSRPPSMVGPTMETVELPAERPPKKVVPGHAACIQLRDDAVAVPVRSPKKHIHAPRALEERPFTPMRRHVDSPKKDPLIFAGCPAEPVRHIKKYIPIPRESPDSRRPATPGRKHLRQGEVIILTHDSPIDPRHYHRRPASASVIGSSSSIALTDANALAPSPIKSVAAHFNGRRSDTPTRARPLANSRSSCTTIDLSQSSFENGESGVANGTLIRPSRKSVTKESLAAMYKPEIPRPRSARKPPVEGARSSSFSSYSLADIAASCENSVPANTSKRMMSDRPLTSSAAVLSTVFRLDEPSTVLEKSYIPAKRPIRKGEASFVFG